MTHSQNAQRRKTKMTTIAKNNYQIVTSRRLELGPRRTKYDICSQILESCIEKQRTKFWLASRLRLSWKIVDETLRFLANGKLIKTTKSGRGTTRYKTTTKGREALTAYNLLVEKYFAP
jgi:predicted transcriptional regulator